MAKDQENQIHELILKRLESMDEKLGIQNGKVARAEDGIKDLKTTTDNLFSSVKADAERIKKIEDMQVAERDKELEMLRKRDTVFRERLMWGVLVTILFILGFVGIINIDFIKAII